MCRDEDDRVPSTNAAINSAGVGVTVDQAALEATHLTFCYGGGATVGTRTLSEPKLVDVNCTIWPGSRVLVAGGNGAGKSTLLSIMGGKRMVPRDQCKIFGKAVFHDSSLNLLRMYCGDWWRTDFFFNITVGELIGEKMLSSPRVQELIDIMQINTSWRINSISDGQRRRCQLLDCLAEEKSVYILDEITTDLDLYAREGLLAFLRRESEDKKATIFYATHIFDHLAEWATHLVFFSGGRLARCCRLDEVDNYRALVEMGTRCPLYTMMKDWIAVGRDVYMGGYQHSDAELVSHQDGPVLQANNLSYSYGGSSPQLSEVSFAFGRGARILVVGANGAGKSTLLSILGGKRMIRRGFASILGKDCFNDTSVAKDVMYCGDWWRTQFFMNLTIGELLGDELRKSFRCQHLAGILEVDLDWKINEISDGMRRRCQLLECLSTPRPVYLMDEITSDLDLLTREGLLNFLRVETEVRGATIFYCTHIFDHLEGWPTQLLHLSKGRVVRSCSMDQVEEYAALCVEGNSTPLYSLIRRWVYAEYAEEGIAKPWRKVDDNSDGRLPNLGLAGPFQVASG
jgi:CCR4-NOT complex subunit CAF16